MTRLLGRFGRSWRYRSRASDVTFVFGLAGSRAGAGGTGVGGRAAAQATNLSGGKAISPPPYADRIPGTSLSPDLTGTKPESFVVLSRKSSQRTFDSTRPEVKSVESSSLVTSKFHCGPCRRQTQERASADVMCGSQRSGSRLPPGHPFYVRLNKILDAAGCDRFVEAVSSVLCVGDGTGRPTASPPAGTFACC